MVIGLAFDLVCDLWTDDCGVKGACLSYDIDQLARSQFYTCIVIKCMSLVAAVVAVCVYKPSQAAATVSPSDSVLAVTVSPSDSVLALSGAADGTDGQPAPLDNDDGGGDVATLTTRHLSQLQLLSNSDLEPEEDNSAETCHL